MFSQMGDKKKEEKKAPPVPSRRSRQADLTEIAADSEDLEEEQKPKRNGKRQGKGRSRAKGKVPVGNAFGVLVEENE
jgi:hypothetical protein